MGNRHGLKQSPVIVYDPDFNPHMDLQVRFTGKDAISDHAQAIARSHRYGQNKKVLVFKLMTKNSVEGEFLTTAHCC